MKIELSREKPLRRSGTSDGADILSAKVVPGNEYFVFSFFFLFALLSFVRFVSVGVFKRRMCNNYQDLVIKA